MASSLNTTGTVNCSDEGADNFKTTNGVCFSKWVGTLKDNKYKDVEKITEETYEVDASDGGNAVYNEDGSVNING